MRRSFTLVELLIVIAIISILAATVMFAIAGAQEKANEARARAQVVRIGELLMRRWEEYRSRPLPIRIQPNQGGNAAARYRLNALRELMRLELPDRMTDIDPNNMASNAMVLPALPSAAQAYRRRIQQAAVTSGAAWSPLHESAECLYLILANMRDGDGVALDGFKASEIGDVDNDGMKEILDPWGNPIHFIRWPYMLRSPLQDGSTTQSPDPFDPFRAGVANPAMDAPNYALFPFVYSAGPDGEYGHNTAPGFVYSGTTLPLLPNNPYAMQDGAMTPNSTGQRIGIVWRDDIHNHLTQ